MSKVELKLRKVVTMIACLAVTTTLFASCEKPEDDKDGEKPDVEFTINVLQKESWTPFAGKTGVTFTNSNNEVLSITDNGTKVEFTGKDIGESTITAKLGDETLKALVRVRGTGGGDGTKKYITYNKPVDAYYIEFYGGVSEANQIDREFDPYAVEAYENKKYSWIHWYGSGWGINHTRTDGTSMYADYGSTQWYQGDGEITDPNDPVAVEWRTEIMPEHYPLDNFAAWVTKNKSNGQFMRDRGAYDNNGKLVGYGLWANARFSDKYELPNNTDVTELYVRSEKVMDIMCDVYKDTETVQSEGTQTWTFWVDPATGLTLKYQETDYKGKIESEYEVTKLIIGKPDWDGKHLHPLATDKIN